MSGQHSRQAGPDFGWAGITRRAIAASLPSIGKLKREKKHHAAVPYKEVPAVVAELKKLNSTSATALLFTIVTAARTGDNAHEIVEAAVVHTQSNRVIAAYAGTTYLDRRRELLAECAGHCLGVRSAPLRAH